MATAMIEQVVDRATVGRMGIALAILYVCLFYFKKSTTKLINRYVVRHWFI
jgi:hypothetical protein